MFVLLDLRNRNILVAIKPGLSTFGSNLLCSAVVSFDVMCLESGQQ